MRGDFSTDYDPDEYRKYFASVSPCIRLSSFVKRNGIQYSNFCAWFGGKNRYVSKEKIMALYADVSATIKQLKS